MFLHCSQTLSRLFDCYLKSKRSPRIEFCQSACAWFDRERRNALVIAWT